MTPVPGTLPVVIPRRPRRTSRRSVAASDLSSTSRSGRRVAARRALTVAALSLFTVPFLAVSASAQDVGTTYDPDPLSAVHAWTIYGGTVVGGFLLAFILTALTSRLSRPSRYRPGQPWEHDTTWIGEKSEDLDDKRSAAKPGTGGASGTW
ncbi:hypothetical protein CcI49_07595 [Frankia sp. CcI49]|uniref:Uncharacterized protein n=1 Tax=Parafrankia irregularis TaxID=795642 RepID=A0A0S4QFM9_9ACTN|nr:MULTISPECIES: hypothetical protein [Frankiaceae]KPM54798.1 hypothetical protein ACG83_15330 [Frankia sp. R43]MBE3206534.1 hypothetical protein [Parafrankia sp. CH37]ONH60988.1 hypothetical protein CcI49_07595 [Frankia sp. CcI49]CUU53970.1 hypothetical protein Ga0074812_101471 [Parafrankia irregularis]